jgi:hypothetical protein
MKTYTGKIETLKDNQIFVFGSNPIGANGNLKNGTGGAALFALKNNWCKDGEKMDNCIAKSGKSWGLTTVTGPGRKLSKTIPEIISNIKILYDYARLHPEKEFMIAYTGTSGYNLNGYTNSALAAAFAYHNIPDNIIFEEHFATLIYEPANTVF